MGSPQCRARSFRGGPKNQRRRARVAGVGIQTTRSARGGPVDSGNARREGHGRRSRAGLFEKEGVSGMEVQSPKSKVQSPGVVAQSGVDGPGEGAQSAPTLVTPHPLK